LRAYEFFVKERRNSALQFDILLNILTGKHVAEFDTIGQP